MNDENKKPSMEDVFPFLEQISEVPLEQCKAAFDRLDKSSPGYQVDQLMEWAKDSGSTLAIITELWPGMEPEKHQRNHLHDLALAFEFAVRLHAGKI